MWHPPGTQEASSVDPCFLPWHRSREVIGFVKMRLPVVFLPTPGNRWGPATCMDLLPTQSPHGEGAALGCWLGTTSGRWPRLGGDYIIDLIGSLARPDYSCCAFRLPREPLAPGASGPWNESALSRSRRTLGSQALAPSFSCAWRLLRV